MTARDELPDLTAVALLVEIADQGSLGAAARRLRLAQPNATRLLRRLEVGVGVPLVERHPRGSRLTAAGLELVMAGRPLLERAREFVRTRQHLAGDGRLGVAASQTVAECLVGAWLAELYAEQPGIEVGLQVCNSDEVTARVLSGQVELGFIESGQVDPRLHSSVVAADRLVVLVAPGHRWSRRRQALTVDELAATPLAVREAGSGTREVLERQLAAHELAAPAVELSSNAAILSAVAADLAPAVLSELAAATHLAAGRVVAVDIAGLDLARRLHAVWSSPRLKGLAHGLVRLAAAESRAAAE